MGCWGCLLNPRREEKAILRVGRPSTLGQIKWKISVEDAAMVSRIVQRANLMTCDPQLHMDITACHNNGCPLDLEKLFAADDLDFAHDVFGIARHIDRDSGRVGGCFLPRFYKSGGVS